MSPEEVVRAHLEASSSVDVDVHLAVVGHVVLTERIDHVVINAKAHDARGMGALEVSADKISAWRDYFPSDLDWT